ncbi:MAG: 30S ribosomal protein S15 [Candidatus Woesearchaeota archaeon]
MARMHSRKKGVSASKRPAKRTHPSWVRYSKNEVELLVIKLSREGNLASKIGIILRDTYGIPDIKKAIGKNITDLLKEKNMAPKVPEDLTSLMKRVSVIKKHLEENHKDMPALRGLQLTESKIKRLVKYYKKTKRLSMEWKYDPNRIDMLLE